MSDFEVDPLLSAIVTQLSQKAAEQIVGKDLYQKAVTKEIADTVRQSQTTSAESIATLIFNAGYRKVADAR